MEKLGLPNTVQAVIRSRIAREQLDQAEALFRDMGMDWWTEQAEGLRGRIDRGEELPWVHIAISNTKRFLLGTYHGVSHKHSQRYLDEFYYRFNRRSWEKQLTSRLLTAYLYTHPITFAELKA